jgi:diguanylate cyclase (GGDEF)-like protein
MLRDTGPFAVIVSDLRMPEMDGVTLLQKARQCSPDTVRVLFSGNADLHDAIEAVNKGAIFRFLLKPCPRVILALTLKAAMEQHQLLSAERVLLEQTLHGSIKALTDILSLAAPLAFGRATRVRQTVRSLVAAFEISDCWHIEVAAMLSQVGCVILPPATAGKVYQGEPLNDIEQAMLGRMPAIVEQVLGNIPRLEPVLEILRAQDRRLDGFTSPDRELIPWGARALKLAMDLDILESQGMAASEALNVMRSRSGWYDTEILEKLTLLRGAEQQAGVEELSLSHLRPGMVLAQDVRTEQGGLLLARGQEVTAGLLEKLRNLSASTSEIEEFCSIKTRLSAAPEGVLPARVEGGAPATGRVPTTPSAIRPPASSKLDRLTGLPDREQAERTLDLLWQAEQRCYALVVVVDSLPTINTRFGRRAGDELFRNYAEFLSRLLSADDQLFRWSGPSFLVLVPRFQNLDNVRDEFRTRIERNKFEHTVRTSTRSVLLPVSPRWMVLPALENLDQYLESIDNFVGALMGREAKDS